MNCIISAGPTFEEIDQVRRITNFSSGKLGCTLADFLAMKGHSVQLLLGKLARFKPANNTVDVTEFGTSEELDSIFSALRVKTVHAVFHAAAVCDFKFGKVFKRNESGAIIELNSKKIPTSEPNLLIELVPTQKILNKLAIYFPSAFIVGWKYEVDSQKTEAIKKAFVQVVTAKTHLCVLNGPAYGSGYGIIDRTGQVVHCDTVEELCQKLEKFALNSQPQKT